MLRKLRIKFVCVNMLIVTLMLLVIFGLVFQSTRSKLEQQSISMMEQLAEDPFRLSMPGEGREDIQLPYFVLQLGRSGDLIAVSGGYYDLSDQDFLAKMIEAAVSTGKSIGTIDEYNLRYCRVVNPMNQRIVFVDISSERATLKSLLETCALLGILSLGVFFGISLMLARWAVKPVDNDQCPDAGAAGLSAGAARSVRIQHTHYEQADAHFGGGSAGTGPGGQRP